MNLLDRIMMMWLQTCKRRSLYSCGRPANSERDLIAVGISSLRRTVTTKESGSREIYIGIEQRTVCSLFRYSRWLPAIVYITVNCRPTYQDTAASQVSRSAKFPGQRRDCSDRSHERPLFSKSTGPIWQSSSSLMLINDWASTKRPNERFIRVGL